MLEMKKIMLLEFSLGWKENILFSKNSHLSLKFKCYKILNSQKSLKLCEESFLCKQSASIFKQFT